MNGKETLALLGVTAAVGGAVGLEVASHERASSRAAAITAETCQETYGGNQLVPDPKITSHTLDCMNEGWIPKGRALDTEGFVKGYPVGLLEGYVKIHKSKASHFDASKPLLFGLLGLGVGLWAAMLTDSKRTRREEFEPEEPEEESEPEPDARPGHA